MNNRSVLAMGTALLTVLACGLPGPALAPTALPLPPTPEFLPLPQPLPADTVAPAAPAASSFAGTWTGADPDDGSVMTLTLVETGSSLQGTYKDSYSGTRPPPGFEGTVSGQVLSPTTGQLTLNLLRAPDGATLNLQANLALSGEGSTLTVVFSSAPPNPWILARQ
jgi:hypothetical protein